jgi:hypothetical protein
MVKECLNSPCLIQQLYLLFFSGLTWRLFAHKLCVDGVRGSIQVGLSYVLHNSLTDEAVLDCPG